MIRRSFFQRDPVTCARELIGCTLVWKKCSGRIVETEAYTEFNDEACHAFFRPSTRLFMAEQPPGTAYVYLNYGVHWLLNVLVKGGSENGFVLVRAIEPLDGLAEMQERRGHTLRTRLGSGPGKLTQAMGISGADHVRDLCAGPEIGFQMGPSPVEVEVDVRIGISRAADFPWRFLLRGSDCVSVPAGRGKAKIRKPSRRVAGLAP